MVDSVAGIDRWRGGWIVAQRTADTVELWVAPTIDDAIGYLEECAVVAIDMPIALTSQGMRPAEAELRTALGSSARSVFTSPTRAAVAAATQAEATIQNRAHGGPGISAQAFGLFASIQELRAALGGPAFAHWWETHPETSFALMNAGVPFASKRSALGVAQRLQVLRNHYPQIDGLLLTSPVKVPIDDVLDALAALWSAERIRDGSATLFGPPGRDDEGHARGIRI